MSALVRVLVAATSAEGPPAARELVVLELDRVPARGELVLSGADYLSVQSVTFTPAGPCAAEVHVEVLPGIVVRGEAVEALP